MMTAKQSNEFDMTVCSTADAVQGRSAVTQSETPDGMPEKSRESDLAEPHMCARSCITGTDVGPFCKCVAHVYIANQDDGRALSDRLKCNGEMKAVLGSSCESVQPAEGSNPEQCPPFGQYASSSQPCENAAMRSVEVELSGNSAHQGTESTENSRAAGAETQDDTADAPADAPADAAADAPADAPADAAADAPADAAADAPLERVKLAAREVMALSERLGRQYHPDSTSVHAVGKIQNNDDLDVKKKIRLVNPDKVRDKLKSEAKPWLWPGNPASLQTLEGKGVCKVALLLAGVRADETVAVSKNAICLENAKSPLVQVQGKKVMVVSAAGPSVTLGDSGSSESAAREISDILKSRGIEGMLQDCGNESIAEQGARSDKQGVKLEPSIRSVDNDGLSAAELAFVKGDVFVVSKDRIVMTATRAKQWRKKIESVEYSNKVPLEVAKKYRARSLHKRSHTNLGCVAAVCLLWVCLLVGMVVVIQYSDNNMWEKIRLWLVWFSASLGGAVGFLAAIKNVVAEHDKWKHFMRGSSTIISITDVDLGNDLAGILYGLPLDGVLEFKGNCSLVTANSTGLEGTYSVHEEEVREKLGCLMTETRVIIPGMAGIQAYRLIRTGSTAHVEFLQEVEQVVAREVKGRCLLAGEEVDTCMQEFLT